MHKARVGAVRRCRATGLGLVFWKGVGTRCRYLKGGHPSMKCLEVKAGNKQGMLGTLAVSSRWECWQRMES